MKWQTAIFSAAALIILAAGSASPIVSVAHASGCEAGDRINGSTADDARKKMESAGFRHVRDLMKGCDNFWHGTAVKDGSESRVAVTPQGQVLREGD